MVEATGDEARKSFQERAKFFSKEAKKKAIEESTAARAAADKKMAEEAEALKEANRIKQAKILEKFEKDKAEFEATGVIPFLAVYYDRCHSLRWRWSSF